MPINSKCYDPITLDQPHHSRIIARRIATDHHRLVDLRVAWGSVSQVLSQRTISSYLTAGKQHNQHLCPPQTQPVHSGTNRDLARINERSRSVSYLFFLRWIYAKMFVFGYVVHPHFSGK